MTKEEIFNNIKKCLAESLLIEEEKITTESALIEELGADSLDLLDIIFSLEKKFGVKLKNSEMDGLLRMDIKDQNGVTQEFISSKAVERLEKWIPSLAKANDKAKIRPAALFNYITVESLVILIKSRLLKPLC